MIGSLEIERFEEINDNGQNGPWTKGRVLWKKQINLLMVGQVLKWIFKNIFS